MLRSFLYLDAQPGKRDQLIAWYQAIGTLERAVETAGCVASEVYIVPEDENQILVTALWESAEDYDRWAQDPWRQSLSEELSNFLNAGFEPDKKGAVYTSVHAVIAS